MHAQAIISHSRYLTAVQTPVQQWKVSAILYDHIHLDAGGVTLLRTLSQLFFEQWGHHIHYENTMEIELRVAVAQKCPSYISRGFAITWDSILESTIKLLEYAPCKQHNHSNHSVRQGKNGAAAYTSASYWYKKKTYCKVYTADNFGPQDVQYEVAGIANCNLGRGTSKYVQLIVGLIS